METDYFEKILEVYARFPEALGVGGYIANEVVWMKGYAPNADFLNMMAIAVRRAAVFAT